MWRKCACGFRLVRVMLPERCWPVETRNCAGRKPVLVSYTTLDIIDRLDLLKLRLRTAPHGSRAPVALSKTSN